MSSAADTVISTTELLELILWHLPMRSLLVTAPLVSKTWQAITLSPILQRALFFQPDTSAASADTIQNPILAEFFQPFFAPAMDGDRPRWPNTVAEIRAMPWSKAPDAFRRRDASWRRMLVRQPPAQTILVRQCSHGATSDERRAVLADLELRMGMLYDLTLRFINRDNTSFCIRWNTGGDNDNTEGNDVMFVVSSPVTCVIQQWQGLGKEFKSVGAKAVVVSFGRWRCCTRRNQYGPGIWDN
ncbi:hypothetical protein DFH06DRAFT_1095597 [Mycena polygramma]|nr:hypothetical protein DFH06DRAFT_1095597 [Mycena polygramma]